MKHSSLHSSHLIMAKDEILGFCQGKRNQKKQGAQEV